MVSCKSKTSLLNSIIKKQNKTKETKKTSQLRTYLYITVNSPEIDEKCLLVVTITEKIVI